MRVNVLSVGSVTQYSVFVCMWVHTHVCVNTCIAIVSYICTFGHSDKESVVILDAYLELAPSFYVVKRLTHDTVAIYSDNL